MTRYRKAYRRRITAVVRNQIVLAWFGTLTSAHVAALHGLTEFDVRNIWRRAKPLGDIPNMRRSRTATMPPRKLRAIVCEADYSSATDAARLARKAPRPRNIAVDPEPQTDFDIDLTCDSDCYGITPAFDLLLDALKREHGDDPLRLSDDVTCSDREQPHKPTTPAILRRNRDRACATQQMESV